MLQNTATNRLATAAGAVRGALLLALSSAVLGCHHRQPVSAHEEGGTPAGLGSTRYTRAATDRVLDFFNAYQWNPMYAEITGFNDEQKLTRKGSSVYGPKVRAYASPLLGSYTAADYAAQSQIVGMMEVYPSGAEPDQAKYGLRLTASKSIKLYCIWLSHSGADVAQNWTGYVTEYNSPSCATPSQSTQLDVDVSTIAGDNDQNDFPSVVRLTLDANEMPAIAVSCLTAVCEIGHTAQNHRPVGFHANSNSRLDLVKTWHDEQVVSIPDPISSNGVKPWANAVVTPSEELATYHVADFVKWRHVATIALSDTPSTGTYAAWKLQAGDNWVWLQSDSKGLTWKAGFSPANAGGPDLTNLFPVQRTNWAPLKVYPTARWVWDDADDLMWVACDQGCCTVSGAQ